MPMIPIEKNEDFLAAFKRYKRTVWYKRINRVQWFGIGIFTTIVAYLLYLASGWDGSISFGFGLG